jgi:hypothetical protein
VTLGSLADCAWRNAGMALDLGVRRAGSRSLRHCEGWISCCKLRSLGCFQTAPAGQGDCGRRPVRRENRCDQEERRPHRFRRATGAASCL